MVSIIKNTMQIKVSLLETVDHDVGFEWSVGLQYIYYSTYTIPGAEITPGVKLLVDLQRQAQMLVQ